MTKPRPDKYDRELERVKSMLRMLWHRNTSDNERNAAKSRLAATKKRVGDLYFSELQHEATISIVRDLTSKTED